MPSKGRWPAGCIPGGAGQPAEPTATPQPIVTSQPSGEFGRITHITDSDTVMADINGGLYSIRLIGMDAPERGHQCANAATQLLTQLIDGRIVKLESDVSNTDRDDRLLRYIFLNGEFINGEMVEAGMAYAKEYPPDTKYVCR